MVLCETADLERFHLRLRGGRKIGRRFSKSLEGTVIRGLPFERGTSEGNIASVCIQLERPCVF